MPFDPNFPPPNSPLNSGPFRNQFNGLKSLIDAVPGVTGVQVDAVNTLDPGNAASVQMSLIGTTLHFTFSIPRGGDGAPGGPGDKGDKGDTGDTGAQGPPFAS